MPVNEGPGAELREEDSLIAFLLPKEPARLLDPRCGGHGLDLEWVGLRGEWPYQPWATVGLVWDCWLPATVALAGTTILCPVVLRVLRDRQVVDVPNERSSHTRPTPRGGGAALLIPVVVATLVGRGSWPLRSGLLVAAIALSAVGLVEDARGIPIGPRFGLQVLIGAAAAPLLVRGARLDLAVSAIAVVVVALWLVAFVNAFNFMDGINGISAVEAIIAGLTYAWLGRGRFPLLIDSGFVVAAAALGFLPFNFPRASMFLGDVGSYLLGAWLAVLAVLTLRDRLGPVAALAPLALYVGDTGMTLGRRMLAREPWRQPHRSHAYQRLLQAGWSQAKVTTLVGTTVTTCSLLGVFARGRSFAFQAGVAALILVIVLAYVGGSWTTQQVPA